MSSEKETDKWRVAEFIEIKFSAKQQKPTVSQENELASKRGRRKQVRPSERFNYPNMYILETAGLCNKSLSRKSQKSI